MSLPLLRSCFNLVRLIEAGNRALLRLSRLLLQEYAALKRERGLVGGDRLVEQRGGFRHVRRDQRGQRNEFRAQGIDGFGREQRLQEANASKTDARYSVRRQELALTADVTSARVTLQAAFEAAQLQARNAATAREALQLAEERYRVGSNTFVDLTTARGEYERAETDRIDAIYEFHRAYAALQQTF